MLRNEIKAFIYESEYTMSQVMEMLSEKYGWSKSVPNFSTKLKRESLRYTEAKQLADVLGYDIVWVKREP